MKYPTLRQALSDASFRAAITALLGIITIIALRLYLPAQAAPPPAPLRDFAAGASEAATGTITGEVASDLAFTGPMGRGIVSNRTGGIAYVSLNRATNTYTTSTTVFDYALDDKEDMIWDIEGGSINLMVEGLTVYVTPATGFRAVGWK